MTKLQIYVFACAYLLVMVVTAVLTRATLRRLLGALAGAAVGSVAMLGIIALGERAGVWHMVMTWEPFYLLLMCLGTIPCGFVYLLTWRIARRFGGRGLVVALFVVAIIGPIRDYRYMAAFPEWGSYAPGLAPVFATSAAYVIFGILGHGVMRLISGPAESDPLARSRIT